MSSRTQTAIDPYRPLFSLGLFSGFFGVLLWPLYLSGHLAYPLLTHSLLLNSGMFLSFVSGFLMTALPRMSGTDSASKWETGIATVLMASAVLLALFGEDIYANALICSQIVFLVVFGLQRIAVRSQSPPPGFMYIPVGLAWCFFGSAIAALSRLGIDLSGEVVLLGKLALQQAFLLNLIVGLGSRLIPFLSRITVVDPTHQTKESYGKSFAALIALNLTFLFEIWFSAPGALVMRFLVFAIVAVKFFKLFKTPQQRTLLGLGLRLSVCTILLALLLLGILPDFRLALLHVLFIGGYALLTMMVATRVVLAHGGQGTQRELASPAIGLTVFLLLLAAGLRAFYLLPWAAGAWAIALCIWAYGIGRFLYK